LNQASLGAFKRQSSLRPSDLPSIQEAKYKDLPTNTILEEVEPVIATNEFNKLSLIKEINPANAGEEAEVPSTTVLKQGSQLSVEELEKKIKPYEEKKNARRDINDFSNGIKKRVNDNDDLGNYLTDKEKKKILDEEQKLKEWLADNPNATKQEILDKRQEFEKEIKPIIEKAEKKKRSSWICK